MIKFSENSEKILSEVAKGFSTIYIDTVLNAVFPEICCTLYTYSVHADSRGHGNHDAVAHNGAKNFFIWKSCPDDVRTRKKCCHILHF